MGIDISSTQQFAGEALGIFRMFTLVDFDALFQQNPEAILLDRLNYADPDYATKLKTRVYTKAGELSFFASCECRHLTGDFYLNQTCPVCHTVVKNDFAIGARIPNETWLSFPESIPGVLQPIAYLVLSEFLKFKGRPSPIDEQLKRKGKPNYLDVILNPKLDLPPELDGIVTGRGHAYLYENFDYLMNYFLNEHKAKKKHKSAPFIKLFIEKYRKVMFCHYVPVLSNILHTITTEPGQSARSLVDRSPQYIMDAAIDLSQLRYSAGRHRSAADFEDLVHRCYKKYISYLEDIEHSLGAKKGLIRLHMFGARFDWSFRTVIIPITTPHCYDELHIPWCVGVNLLKIHIIGQLTQAGMSIEEAAEKQARAVIVYDPDIDVIIRRMIDEHPEKGLPSLWNRNPSLQRGSIQKLFITRVKTDVTDLTVSMSVLVLKDPNADFDGDALNGFLILEHEASKAYEVLHPSQRVLAPNEPNMSTTIDLPKQILLQMNTFLDYAGVENEPALT